MTLKFIILALLDKKSMTGYDLQKKIENTINYFWPSTQSQIYRSLKDLSQKGYLTVKTEVQDEKPNKKNYSITKKGQDKLKKWLLHPVEIPNHRNVFLVHLFFSKKSDPKVILNNLNAYEKEIHNRYEFLTSEEIKSRVADRRKRSEVINEIVVKNGVMALKNELNWIAWARKRIAESSKARR